MYAVVVVLQIIVEILFEISTKSQHFRCAWQCCMCKGSYGNVCTTSMKCKKLRLFDLYELVANISQASSSVVQQIRPQGQVPELPPSFATGLCETLTVSNLLQLHRLPQFLRYWLSQNSSIRGG
jgi:hypothetical protein